MVAQRSCFYRRVPCEVLVPQSPRSRLIRTWLGTKRIGGVCNGRGVRMARPRSKPDFTAGVVLSDEVMERRALELRVRADNLYAVQPRRGKAVKSSYHSSGQFHFKIGGFAASKPTIELPPRFVKESAFPLGHGRRCLFAISLENAPTLLQYTGQPYDYRIDLKLP